MVKLKTMDDVNQWRSSSNLKLFRIQKNENTVKMLRIFVVFRVPDNRKQNSYRTKSHDPSVD